MPSKSIRREVTRLMMNARNAGWKVSMCAALLFTGACGKKSDSSTDSSPGTPVSAAESVGNLILAVNAVGGLAGHSTTALAAKAGVTGKKALSTSISTMTSTGFGSDWSNSSAQWYVDYANQGSGFFDAKTAFTKYLDPEYKGNNGSSDFEATVFGKVRNNVMFGCVFATLIPADSDGMLTVGTHTLTFDAASFTKVEPCGVTAAIWSGVQGGSMDVTVAATTDKTHYDRKLVYTPPGGAENTGLYRSTSKIFNYTETQNENNGVTLERTMISYDIANGKLMLEIMSGEGTNGSGMGSAWLYRLAYDQKADVAKVVVRTPMLANDPVTVYTLAGKPKSADSTVAFSIRGSERITGGQGSSGHDTGVKAACVNPADQTVATDNSVECGVTGVLVDDAGLQAVFDDFRFSSGTTVRTTFSGWGNIAETQNVPFTIDTVFTAKIEHP